MRQINLLDLMASKGFETIQDPYELLKAIENSDCTRCRRADWRQAHPEQKITVYRGNPQSDFWVIGKSPGVNDGIEGMPFCHGSGDILRKWIRYLGMDPETGVFMVNPVFCAAEGEKTPTAGEMKECSFYFNMLVERFRPKTFLCLGMTAWRAVATIPDHFAHGLTMAEIAGQTSPSQSRWPFAKHWLVYHPAYFFKGTSDADDAKKKTTQTLAALRGTLRVSQGSSGAQGSPLGDVASSEDHEG